MTLPIEQYENIQCFSGHVYQVPKGKLRQLGYGEQLDRIESGQKLDAVILATKDCEECEQEAVRRQELYDEMDLNLFGDGPRQSS